MQVKRLLEVPTGHIAIVEGEHGLLECISIGDYGKNVNLKCDAMGLSREIERVEHQQMLPLEEKWVITISTQYGCSMGCTFCDVPKVGPGRNATKSDLIGQVMEGIRLHPEVEKCRRLNVHFARMGEPTWNLDVLSATVELYEQMRERAWGFHPVVSTMMPKSNLRLAHFLNNWMYTKNVLLKGEAGLQLSINTTDDSIREQIFGGNAMSLDDVSAMMHNLATPVGRKITLNFALAGWPVNAEKLRDLFDPARFVVKLTPMHKTETALRNSIKTEGDYTTFHPYKDTEEALKAVGFNVLVFIASKEEDLGRITCGNAILAGTKPLVDFRSVNI